MTKSVIADARVEQPKDWHTYVLPLGASEEPPRQFVSQSVIAAFRHLPFAEARLPLMHFEIVEDDGGRRLVGRFPRWKDDPPPDMSQFQEMTNEEYRKAMLAKGNV